MGDAGQGPEYQVDDVPGSPGSGYPQPNDPPKYAPRWKHVPCQCKHPAAWCPVSPCMGGHTASLPAGQAQRCSSGPPSKAPRVSSPWGPPTCKQECPPQESHALARGCATATRVSPTPRSPAVGRGVQDVAPSLPVEAASPEWGGHGHHSGRAGANALVLVNVRDVRHCFINVQMLPNKEAQVGPELPVRAGGRRQGWGGAERWGSWSHPGGRWWWDPGSILQPCTHMLGTARASMLAHPKASISASLPAENLACCPALPAPACGRGTVVASWATAVGTARAIPQSSNRSPGEGRHPTSGPPGSISFQ